MKKTWMVVVFIIMIVGSLGFFIYMDASKEIGFMSGHWWWGGELLLILLATIIWLVIWISRSRQPSPKKEEKKENIIRGDIFEYQYVIDSFWKDKRNKDPDMYKIDEIYSFPSEENPKIKIIKTKEGYNSHKVLLIAIDTVTKNVIDKAEGTDLKAFKENLHPKLLATATRIETDLKTGQKSEYTYTQPLPTQKTEETKSQEASKEKERQDTMESTKKEAQVDDDEDDDEE